MVIYSIGMSFFMETLGFTFGIMGMSLGTMGFIFGIICLIKNRKTYKTTERKGNPRRELQGGVNHCSKTIRYC